MEVSAKGGIAKKEREVGPWWQGEAFIQTQDCGRLGFRLSAKNKFLIALATVL